MTSCEPLSIEPVRVWDLLKMTRMAYENMTGVDVEFTRFAENPLLHTMGYLILPLYLLTAGQGYKAVVNGETAGCAYLHLRRLSGLVFNVNVNAAFRRHGVGTALMEYVEEEARASGNRWLGLQVDEGNLPAESLYDNLGYRSYHPYLFRGRFRSLTGPVPGALELQPQPRREGARLFQRYGTMERQEGDPWAAPVVTAEFDEGPPADGKFWRCLWNGEEAGAVWLSGGAEQRTLVILLKSDLWGEASLSRGLVHLLQREEALAPSRLDLYFGSSAHHEAALPTMRELGFSVRRRPRILMLKELL